MLDNKEFKELLSRFQSGEDEAGRELFQKFPEMLNPIVRAMVNEFSEKDLIRVSDIIQSTIKDVIGNPNHLAQSNNPVAYLRQMARNKLIDRIRTLCGRNTSTNELENVDSSRPKVQTGMVFDQFASTGTRDSESVRNRDFMSTVMERLSADEKVLLEAWLAGEQWSVAGMLLGITAATARMRFIALLQRLRKEFPMENYD